MNKVNYISKLLAVCLLMISGTAVGQSPTAPAKGFNVFVRNNFTANSSETEGPVAMGGNLIINGGYGVNIHNEGNFSVNGAKIGLVVGGQVNFVNGTLQVLNDRYVKIGNGSNLTVWYTDNNGAASPMKIIPAGQPHWYSNAISMSARNNNVAGFSGTVSASNNPVLQANVINFAAAFDTMQNTSISLSSCTNNAVLKRMGNGGVMTTLTHPYTVPIYSQMTIDIHAGANILNIDGSQLNNFSEMNFSGATLSNSNFLIINVNAPGSFTWTPVNMNGIQNEHGRFILFNFYNTTTLTMGGSALKGTIFAPFANINKSNNWGNVDGQVIGLSYNSVGGENHYEVFSPSYTGCSAPPANTVANFSVNNAIQCLSGNTFVFTNSSTGNGTLTYNWNFGDGTTSTNANPTKTYTNAGNYIVRLIANGTSGADTAYQTMVVNNAPAMPGNFTVSSPVVYQGQVNVTYTVPSAPGVSYVWSYTGTGAAFSGTGNSITINFDTIATSGTLKVKATNGYGCGESAERTINILVKPYMTWTCGGSDNAWNNPANWDGGFVPYGTISVYIPGNASCNPDIDDDEEVRDITVDNGKEIDIDCSKKLKVLGNAKIEGKICGCGTFVIKGHNRKQYIAGNGIVCHMELDNDSSAVIVPGDTIHICKSYKPTSGKLYTNSGLELLSDSANCNGMILKGNGCDYIIGDVIINKFVQGGRRAFRFLGHPFSHSVGLNMLTPWLDITGQGGAANGFTPTLTNNPSAFWYNTLTGNGSTVNDVDGWIPFTHTDGQGANAWKKMQGIRVLFRGAKGQGLQSCCDYTPSSFTFKMHGPVNQCDVTHVLQSNANKGFNFIGNPFAANVEMSETVRGSAVGYYFSVWNPHMGTAGAYYDQPFNFSYILPAYSAFIVRNASNSNNTITFPESSKRADDATHNLFKTTSSTYGNNSVQLRILSDNDEVFWDRLLLFFNNQAVPALDAYDAEKMSNPGLNFYTLSANNDKLSIDTRPLVQQSVIELGIETDVIDKTYTLYVEDYDIEVGTTLYLHDKYLNVVEPLTAGMSYDFTITSDPASQGAGRFEINVSNSTTSAENIQKKAAFKLEVLPNPAVSYINVDFTAPKAGATSIKVTNVIGAQVFSQVVGTVDHKVVNIPVHQLSSGVYMVTVQCGDYIETKRFVKQ